jgi:hypothetical protein
MRNPTHRLQLELVRSNNNDATEGTQFRLKITDATTNLAVAEVHLDAETFADLMSSRTTGSVDGVPAWMPGGAVRQLWGRHAANVSRTFESDAFRDADHAADWVASAAEEIGAYSYDAPRRDGSREWVLIFRNYLPTAEAAQQWCGPAQYDLDQMGVWA